MADFSSQAPPGPSAAQLSASSIPQQFGAWSLSFDDLLSNLEHQLQGHVVSRYDDNKEPVWAVGTAVVVNQEGAVEIRQFMESLVTKVVALSKVSKDQAQLDCRVNADAIATFLWRNFRRFDLKPTSYRFLCERLNNLMEFAIMKAGEGWTFSQLHTQTHDVNTVQNVSQPQAQPTGLMGLLRTVSK